MAKLFNLSGTYSINRNYLINPTFKFLIAKRKEFSKRKPFAFLLDKTTPAGSYISSLYFKDSDSTGKDVYTFDYQGYNYTLTLDKPNNLAEIRESNIPIS